MGLVGGLALAVVWPVGSGWAREATGGQAEIVRLRAEIEALAQRLREIEERGLAADRAIADQAVEPVPVEPLGAMQEDGGARNDSPTATGARWLMVEARRARASGDLESAELYFAAVIEAYEGESIASEARAELLDLYRSRAPFDHGATVGEPVFAQDDENGEQPSPEPLALEADNAPAGQARDVGDDALVAEVLAELRRRRSVGDQVVDFGGGVSAPAGELDSRGRRGSGGGPSLVDGEALLREALPDEFRDDVDPALDARPSEKRAADGGASVPADGNDRNEGVVDHGLARSLLGLGGDPADFRASVGDRVFFRAASADIDPAAAGVLEAQARWIIGFDPAHVTIEGHADEPGTDAQNLDLSVARAQAVRLFLIENGVSEDLIEIVAFGRTEPVAQCDRDICARQNRRVVTVVGAARARPGRVSHEQRHGPKVGEPATAVGVPATGTFRVSRVEPVRSGSDGAETIVESGERGDGVAGAGLPRAEAPAPQVAPPVRRRPRDISEALRQIDLSRSR